MKIYCCGCLDNVDAILTNGKEIYSHRRDLYDLPFWKCGTCHNYVGCHHKTKNRTRPLGDIPTKEIRNARRHIHAILDPLWQSKMITRHDLYADIGRRLSANSGYHTSNIRTIDEARKVYKIVLEIRREKGLNNIW